MSVADFARDFFSNIHAAGSVSDISATVWLTALSVTFIGFEAFDGLLIPVGSVLLRLYYAVLPRRHKPVKVVPGSIGFGPADDLSGAVIPHQAPPLPQLSRLDRAFQLFSKVCAATFLIACIKFSLWEGAYVSTEWCPSLPVNHNEAKSLSSSSPGTCGEWLLKRWLPSFAWQLPLLFIVYDFFYTLMHWGLHIPFLYPWIHKHHHRQMSPFRGNADAINVHPIEFMLGDYNHILATFIVTRITGARGEFHALTFFLFVLIGGFFASANHTRWNFTIPFGIYDVKYHDVHHRLYNCNYGQYIMLWDRVFGTFVPFTARVDNAAQGVKTKEG